VLGSSDARTRALHERHGTADSPLRSTVGSNVETDVYTAVQEGVAAVCPDDLDFATAATSTTTASAPMEGDAATPTGGGASASESASVDGRGATGDDESSMEVTAPCSVDRPASFSSSDLRHSIDVAGILMTRPSRRGTLESGAVAQQRSSVSSDSLATGSSLVLVPSARENLRAMYANHPAPRQAQPFSFNLSCLA
jgi:hypothetical protein